MGVTLRVERPTANAVLNNNMLENLLGAKREHKWGHGLYNVTVNVRLSCCCFCTTKFKSTIQQSGGAKPAFAWLIKIFNSNVAKKNQ